MNRFLLVRWLFILAMLAPLGAFAQNIISGRITSIDDKQPIPGVSVRVRESKAGTISDASGRYQINANPGQTLVVSSVGYMSQEFKVTSSNVQNIALPSNQKALNEVVVVGYGTEKRKNVTGALTTVKGDDLATLVTPSFDNQLAGRSSGVDVTTTEGILGTSPKIRIRGVNSITSGSDPLYVVDGIPIITGTQSIIVNTNPLSDINPNDIETIDVLKDGSATAIYGSRAANGVVLITTKRGKKGEPKLNLDVIVGTASTVKRFDLLDAQDFVTISNEKFKNAGVDPQAFLENGPNGKPISTNWQDVIFRTGIQQSYNLSFSNATDKTNYYASVGYNDFTGTSVANDMVKYSLRINVEQKATKWLTVGVNAGLTYTRINGLNTDAQGLSGNVANAISAFPNVPVFNPDGSYNINAAGAALGRGANLSDIDFSYPNIKFVLDHNINRNTNITLIGNAFAEAQLLPGLKLRTQASVNGLQGEDYEFWDPRHGDGRPTGYSFQQSYPSIRYEWQNTLSYDKTIGASAFNVVVGTEIQKETDRSFNGAGTGISNFFYGQRGLITNTLTVQNSGGDYNQSAFLSYFGRINYSLYDRYLISLTARNDKISALPIGHQEAFLPGGSIGWRVSREDFWKNSETLKFFSNLKIRASYAKVGNVDIGFYPALGLFNPALYGTQAAAYFSQFANSNLKFETSKKFDLGADLGFFDNRLTFTFDYYKNNINNLILAVPQPPSFGIPGNSINENIGNMYNKGFEFAISSQNITKGDFNWTTDFNVSFTKNRVTKLYQGQSIIGVRNVIQEGKPVGSFYGWESAGVNTANGNPLYKKADGTLIQGNVDDGSYYGYDPKNPGILGDASDLSATTDKKVLGNGIPTFFGGLNNTITFKGIDFSFLLSFSGGNKIYNATKSENLYNDYFLNNSKDILRRWTTPGQVTDIPKVEYGSGDFVNNTGNATSRFLENGNYIKARNITLGYSFPKDLLKKWGVAKLRLFVQVQNAFTITKYSGLDPELTSRPVGGNNVAGGYTNLSSNLDSGVDFAVNPPARIYSIGLNLGF